MSEAVDTLPTMQQIWMRPSFFAELDDENDRAWLEDNYPDGLKVVFVGEAYAESANESMDDHWSLGCPVRGHGMSTPAYGYSALSVQDMFMDALDLEMATHMRAIPAIYADPQFFDFPAYSKEKAQPGMRYPLKHGIDDTINIQEKVWAEPQIQVSAQLITLRNDLSTSLLATVTGISPAAIGRSDEDNTTLGGITQLRAASRGEAGTAFVGFVEAYSRSCMQAIRIAARYRQAEADEKGVLRIKRPNSPDVLVDLVELRDANLWCVPTNDQTYPATQEEEQMALTGLIMAAQNGDESAKAQLSDPANAELIASLRGISGLKSSVGDIGIKVFNTIELLVRSEPKPIPEAVEMVQQGIQQTLAAGKPAPEPDPYKIYKSSLEPGPLDDVAKEYPFFQSWIYSQGGQQMRFERPSGYLNVELYAMKLQQMMKSQIAEAQAAQVKPQLAIEAAKKQVSPKSPTESIAFKDLGPQGKIQLAKQAGLDVSADMAADMTEEHMVHQPPQSRKLKRV